MIWDLGSCVSMSKTQLKRVGSLAVMNDSVLVGLESVLKLLDEVRLCEKGCSPLLRAFEIRRLGCLLFCCRSFQHLFLEWGGK